jgi:hypothetical protein
MSQEAYIKYGQDWNTLGILVMSIIPLQVSTEDIKGSQCEKKSFMEVTNSLWQRLIYILQPIFGLALH